jgi:hypothetical protein
MKTLSAADFISWVRGRGIDLHETYPTTAILTFPPEADHSRFWCIPRAPERRPFFIATILDLVGNWASCFVWRHSGSWPRAADPGRINDVVELRILTGLGLPLGTADVVEFARAERDALIALIFSNTVFGWSVGDDMYVIPDDARYIIQTDHHEVIHVSFRSAEDLAHFVKEMEDRGFPLPNELPDATFKPTGWMKGK